MDCHEWSGFDAWETDLSMWTLKLWRSSPAFCSSHIPLSCPVFRWSCAPGQTEALDIKIELCSGLMILVRLFVLLVQQFSINVYLSLWALHVSLEIFTTDPALLKSKPLGPALKLVVEVECSTSQIFCDWPLQLAAQCVFIPGNFASQGSYLWQPVTPGLNVQQAELKARFSLYLHILSIILFNVRYKNITYFLCKTCLHWEHLQNGNAAEVTHNPVVRNV